MNQGAGNKEVLRSVRHLVSLLSNFQGSSAGSSQDSNSKPKPFQVVFHLLATQSERSPNDQEQLLHAQAGLGRRTGHLDENTTHEEIGRPTLIPKELCPCTPRKFCLHETGKPLLMYMDLRSGVQEQERELINFYKQMMWSGHASLDANYKQDECSAIPSFMADHVLQGSAELLSMCCSLVPMIQPLYCWRTALILMCERPSTCLMYNIHWMRTNMRKFWNFVCLGISRVQPKKTEGGSTNICFHMR
ncbi:hypothetical protein AMELA_G00270810 [Ameiurus melas]|uniref:Uncharacterized protein n=1 Tax=Ameiurus melas TaxID=219545 RepID=A0A7J5ZQV5_AMEME|nr:hypothetical protein AMELA_G00270810 [Ameiurus melas]